MQKSFLNCQAVTKIEDHIHENKTIQEFISVYHGICLQWSHQYHTIFANCSFAILYHIQDEVISWV